MSYGPSARISGAMGWRGTLLLALLLAAAALLAGCSQEQSSTGEEGQQQGAGAEEATLSTPVEVVQVAYRKTAEAQTAKVDMTIDMNMGGAPEGQPKGQSKGGMSMQMGGQGEIDFENQKGSFTLQMPMGAGEMEMRNIGNVAYMRMPEAAQAQNPEGRPWVRMDLDEMAQEKYGTSFAEAQYGAQNDPTRQLEFLRSVSDSVEEVGEEEVRGEPTTHYTAVIDLEKAAEAQEDLPEEARQAQKRQAQQVIEQLGTSEMPVDVWIDDEGRLRRFEMNMALPSSTPTSPPAQSKGPQFKTPGQDAEGEIEIAYELYDFGTPVEVEEPPADQATDMEEFMAAQQNRKGKEKAKGKGKQKEKQKEEAIQQ